jgi:hypothetical protein
VLVRQRNVIAAAFHPELTDDLRVHRMLIEQCLASRPWTEIGASTVRTQGQT